jgi:hypothetical protein
LSDGAAFYTAGAVAALTTFSTPLVSNAMPTGGIAVGASDGVNFQGLRVDSANALRVTDENSKAPQWAVGLLAELRVMNVILHQTLNSRDDLDLLRNDAMQTLSLIN